MYNSISFDLSNPPPKNLFASSVLNVYKVITDMDYYHYVDEEEKAYYKEDVLSFIRCTKGSMKLYLADQTYILQENDCLFLHFSDLKKYKSMSPLLEYNWVNFTAVNYDSIFQLKKIYHFLYTIDEEQSFHKLLQYGKAESSYRGYINHLYDAYLYLLFFECASKESHKQKSQKTVDEICAFIDQKIYSKISVEEIAIFFNISSRRLRQIFAQELEISPKNYILKKKMEEGYRLVVQTSLSVHEISEILCFNSSAHFSNCFYHFFHLYPTQLRAM